MKIEVVDQAGGVVGGGKGTDILNNPLNVVLWIADRRGNYDRGSLR